MPSKEQRYSQALQDLNALFAPGHYELDTIGKMASVASVLYRAFPEWVFVGFYRVVQPGRLIIGPYQGLVLACGSIDFGRGVCGAVAESGTPLIVPDVTQFPGYIACDSETQSEIVLPVFHSGKLVAVLDVDSPQLNAFNNLDAQWLQKIANLVI